MAFGVKYDNEAQGILNANIASLDQSFVGQSVGITLATNQFRYNLFFGPSQQIDQLILDAMGSSNTTKGSIVTNGSVSNFLANPIYYGSESAAESGVQAIFGTAGEAGTSGVLSNVTSYFAVGFSTLSPISFSAGASASFNGANFGTNVWDINTDAGIFAIKDWDKSATVSIGDTITVGGVDATVDSIQYVGVGEVYQDIVAVSSFPNLEPPDPNAESPLAGGQTISLSGSNKGVGVSNTSYPGGVVGGSFGNLADVQGGLTRLDDVLAFDTTSGSGAASAISADRTTIGGFRGTMSTQSQNGSTIKELKKEYAINIWMLENSGTKNLNSKTQFQGAIDVLDSLPPTP